MQINCLNCIKLQALDRTHRRTQVRGSPSSQFTGHSYRLILKQNVIHSDSQFLWVAQGRTLIGLTCFCLKLR